LQTQGQWRPTSASTVGLSYTYSRLRGNDLSETGPNATISNQPLAIYYPEYLNYSNRIPEGILPEDTPHRLRLWGNYDFRLGRAGVLTVSGIQFYESCAPYSALGTIDASGRTAGTAYTGLPAFQCNASRTTNCYTLSGIGTSHNYYFSKRGA